MAKCYNCGGEIIFRVIDGKSTPIHTASSNGWCGNDLHKSDSVKSITFDNFCTPTNCPECGDGVFFLRHNGGSVWVDFLGKPWTKHACFDKNSEPQWIKQIRDKSASLNLPIAGVVFSSARTNKGIQLVINGQKSSWYEIVIKSQNTSEFFIGKLVLIDTSLMQVIFSDFPTMAAISIDLIKKPKLHGDADIHINPTTKNQSMGSKISEIEKRSVQLNDDIQLALSSAAFFAIVENNLSPFDDLIDGLKDTGIDIHALIIWIFIATGAVYENGKFILSADYNQKVLGSQDVSKKVAMSHIEKFNSIKWTDLIPEE